MKLSFWKAIANYKEVERIYNAGQTDLREVKKQFLSAKADGHLTMEEAIDLVVLGRTAILSLKARLDEIEKLVSK